MSRIYITLPSPNIPPPEWGEDYSDRLLASPEVLPALDAHGYTSGMKTAISLPDDLFRAAERQAQRARKSRSQLYAEALAEYLARHAPEEVTEAMNRVVERVGQPGPDLFLVAAGRRAFERTEW